MSELLKAAIADAKAVRATALANAKAALQEAFTPKLQSMLSAKLQQEISDEEATDNVAPVAPVVPDEAPVSDEAPVEQPHADLAQDMALGGEAPAPQEEVPVADEFSMDDEESLEEYQPLGAGNPEPVDQTLELTEDDNALSTAPAGHKTEDPQGPSKELSKGPGKAEKTVTAGEPHANAGSKKTIDREVSSAQKDPQGASKELSSGPSKTESGTAPLKEVDDVEIDDASLDEILRELENEVNVAASSDLAEPTIADAPAAPVAQCEVESGDEEIDLNELLSEDDDSDADDKEEDDEKEDKEDRGNKEPWMKENVSLKAELAEYRSTVNYLRDRINEVNLLNAKLLYTNRLFKANSMTNEQKLRVIESFDLTKSVREAKLVYATLSESLNFGAKTAAKPSPKAAVRSITEGLASKSVASTKPTKPALLTEGQEMANRFKKLAGIK